MYICTSAEQVAASSLSLSEDLALLKKMPLVATLQEDARRLHPVEPETLLLVDD